MINANEIKSVITFFGTVFMMSVVAAFVIYFCGCAALDAYRFARNLFRRVRARIRRRRARRVARDNFARARKIIR